MWLVRLLSLGVGSRVALVDFWYRPKGKTKEQRCASQVHAPRTLDAPRGFRGPQVVRNEVANLFAFCPVVVGGFGRDRERSAYGPLRCVVRRVPGRRCEADVLETRPSQFPGGRLLGG